MKIDYSSLFDKVFYERKKSFRCINNINCMQMHLNILGRRSLTKHYDNNVLLMISSVLFLAFLYTPVNDLSVKEYTWSTKATRFSTVFLHVMTDALTKAWVSSVKLTIWSLVFTNSCKKIFFLIYYLKHFEKHTKRCFSWFSQI